MEQSLNRHSLTLELDKILARLSKRTTCHDAAERALAQVPSQCLDQAARRMAETADAHMLMARFGAPSFGGLENIDGPLARAEAGGRLTMGELLKIASVLRAIRGLVEWKSRCEGVKSGLDERFFALTPNRYLEDLITTAIVSEEEMSDHASPALATIRRRIRAASSRVREQLDKIIRSPVYHKALQDPIVTIRAGRFVVPVKAEQRGEVPGLVHDTSASGATIFVEPMSVVEANNEIKVMQAKETIEIERILDELSTETGGFVSGIAGSYALAVELDLIFAKAKLAYDMNASTPALNDRGAVHLKSARHPLLDPKTVVPIDIRLGENFDVLVITGPNTGGKTVALKTLGLLTLMVMCGLMIPADEGSQVAVFDHVLADIGDEQSIEQSLSTFSAHMTNMIHILKTAGPGSLVLLDELGAGTDPAEGAALAVAIIEELHRRGAKLAATTHYAEIKAYALETPGVVNASCEFDVKSLRPTYRLLIGLPGRSNAFAILERLGMNEEIIERARALVADDAARFEQVVESLQQSRQGLEEERDQAALLLQKAHAQAEQARQEKDRLERERAAELDKARTEACRIVESARSQTNRLLGELEDIKKKFSGDNAADQLRRARAAARAGLAAAQDAADPVDRYPLDEDYRLPRPLRAGDTVMITDIDKRGVVLGPPSGNNVLVQAGIIKTRVKLANLRLVEDSPPTASQPDRRVVKTFESGGGRAARRELDMRGKMADEALMDLDIFLDDALLAGLESVTVIHGKGTGALRTAVRQHLKTHRSVGSFRRGAFGEGEDGVTVVELA